MLVVHELWEDVEFFPQKLVSKVHLEISHKIIIGSLPMGRMEDSRLCSWCRFHAFVSNLQCAWCWSCSGACCCSTARRIADCSNCTNTSIRIRGCSWQSPKRPIPVWTTKDIRHITWTAKIRKKHVAPPPQPARVYDRVGEPLLSVDRTCGWPSSSSRRTSSSCRAQRLSGCRMSCPNSAPHELQFWQKTNVLTRI